MPGRVAGASPPGTGLVGALGRRAAGAADALGDADVASRGMRRRRRRGSAGVPLGSGAAAAAAAAVGAASAAERVRGRAGVRSARARMWWSDALRRMPSVSSRAVDGVAPRRSYRSSRAEPAGRARVLGSLKRIARGGGDAAPSARRGDVAAARGDMGSAGDDPGDVGDVGDRGDSGGAACGGAAGASEPAAAGAGACAGAARVRSVRGSPRFVRPRRSCMRAATP